MIFFLFSVFIITAYGYGAGGLHQYEFEMNFYKKVNPDVSICKLHVY